MASDLDKFVGAGEMAHIDMPDLQGQLQLGRMQRKRLAGKARQHQAGRRSEHAERSERGFRLHPETDGERTARIMVLEIDLDHRPSWIERPHPLPRPRTYNPPVPPPPAVPADQGT